MKTFLLSAFLLVVGASGFAQELNMKWGKPTDEELNMTSYAQDPEADAVVLCKTTDVMYDYVVNKFKVNYDIKCRVKVLKDAGKECANVTVPFHYNNRKLDNCEIVSKVKATAYNMENGKLVKTKMDNSMVFYEDVSKKTRLLKFSVPQVKQGTVIEYEFTIISDFPFNIKDWNAQASIPVRYTSYHIRIPEYFKFNVSETGFESLTHKTNTTPMRFSLGNGEGISCEGADYTFIGENLPALKKEKYVYNELSYGTKVGIELSEISIPGSYYKNFTTTWEDIDQMLLNDDDFGGRLGKNPLKKQMTEAGIYNITDDEERIAATCKLLRSLVKWNDKTSCFAESASKVLKEGTGSNADINFILINMLNDAGLKAVPVVLRTRNDGIMPIAHPTYENLTSMIVKVSNGSNVWYIDGSSVDGYLNVLPDIMIVESARSVEKNVPGEWIDLTKASVSRVNTSIVGAISADGTIQAERTSRYSGRAAAQMREKFRLANDSIDFMRKLPEFENSEIESYRLEGHKDFTKNVGESIIFKSSCSTVGGKLLLMPLLYKLFEEAPFTSPERKLPIEFPCLSITNTSTSFTIPDGYSVEKIPDPISLKMPDGSMSFVMIIGVEDNIINTHCQMQCNKVLFSAQNYAQLKEFFDTIIKKSEDIVVIQKN